MPVVNCLHCAQQFYAKPAVLKRGNGKYCSMVCYTGARPRGEWKACAICNASSYKSPKDLERSKSSKFFCSKRCQTIWRNGLYTGELHRNYTTGESSYRTRLKRERPAKRCLYCGIQNERTLAVHHIDKNRKNNKLENLAWLCHNCHFLIHHYEGEYAKFMATIV